MIGPTDHLTRLPHVSSGALIDKDARHAGDEIVLCVDGGRPGTRTN